MCSSKILACFIFFFSSRRRHTRLVSDWSSDVCSSDLDLDDAGYGVACLTEEFQAHGPGVLGHAMQDPSRSCNQPVAALFLNARQSAQEFIGDVLAQSDLAKFRAFDVEPLAAQNLGLAGILRAILPNQFETRDRCIVDLAQIVVQARD